MMDDEDAPDAGPSAEGAGGRSAASLSLIALGVVYGDIGTSPLYALRECFHGTHAVPVTRDNVLGVLSLVFWSLTIVISLKYLTYVMRADNRGEGGILALMALARPPTSGGRGFGVTVVFGLFGAALLYGDGMITPAISVLSAMEGVGVFAPELEYAVLPATVVVLIALFLFQRHGTARVGSVFGPVTLLWFVAIAALGVRQILSAPEVLQSLSPHFAVRFFLANGVHAFLVLGAVFLVVTGGEALYADMGHFGRRPIQLTWFAVVLPGLLASYFGQGALLLAHPEAASNPFYRMAPGWAVVPLIVLATLATVIASQAVISGAFSLTRQATMLGFLPRMRIQHTSPSEIGQIYVPGLSRLLMIASIGLVLGFGSSSNLAAAYGIAVTTTMVITTLLAFVVARQRWGWSLPVAIGVTALLLGVDISFFGANLVKIAHGGWFPLAVAGAVFLLMTTWRHGRRILGERIVAKLVPLKDFFELMRVEPATRVPGAAVFMTSNVTGTPPALMQNFLHNRVVHERVILLTVVTEEIPRVPYHERAEVEWLPEGFVRVVAHYGFMETPDMPALIARPDTPTPPLQYTTFFMGTETLLPRGQRGMAPWRERLFAVMSRNALPATAFFNIPADRVMEVGTQIVL